MTKVSIIVPVYNTENYIERCLNSLVNQTLEDIEIIVVNDGSTDNTGKILQKYRDKIKIIEQKNSGIATTRNKGLEIATGKYIAFVDSDDWLEIDEIEKLYNKAIDNDFDCVMCNYWYIDDKKKWNGVVSATKDITNINDKKEFIIKMFPVIWDKLYKREKIKSFKFKDGVWAEDVEYLYRIMSNINSIGIVEDKLYYYYQREKSDSRLYDKRVYDYIDNFNGIIDFYKKNNLYNEYKTELEYCYVRYLYATFIKRAAHFKNKKDYYKAVDTAIKNVKNTFPSYKKNKYFYKNLKGLYLVLFNKTISKILYKVVSK